MKVAVLGKGSINETLINELNRSGVTSVEIADMNSIIAVKGEIGNFSIRDKQNEIKVSHIVITEEPQNLDNNTEISSGGVKRYYLKDSNLSELPYSNKPVVFVLDYPFDSPGYMTRLALEKSIELAVKRRRVIYLSRYMRTSGDMLESLYRDARKLGVTFYKYDRLDMSCIDEETHIIKASDMADSFEIMTNAPVFTGEEAYTKDLLKIAKLLKLKSVDDGHINEDTFYLFPSVTSRKGIYFTNLRNTSGSGEELLSRASCIVSEITRDLREGLKTEEYSEVDKEKCAFCYTCYRACPHLAMAPDYENSAMKNLNASCSGCGICFSICPANAITMKRNAEKFEKLSKASLKILCCENSGEFAYKGISERLKEESIEVEITSVACGGELSAETMVKVLKNFDKLLVSVCVDKACRHFEGNKRAKRYVERAKEMLKVSGMDENRIGFVQLSQTMPEALYEYIREMVKKDGGVINDCC
jgi:Pyruvate/2-oxoacid:ferredoxin oxidoreductase delta subunit/coenzyme F420-reducing hydrogenase delta subunit